MKGFGRPARRRQVKYYIVEEKLEGIRFLETIKENFTQKELDELFGGNSFSWAWKSTRGTLGGILVGIKVENFEVRETEQGDYFISMVLRNRVSNFRWELVTMYDPAQHQLATNFISQLSMKCMGSTLPMLFWRGGGGFNLIRFATDKNNNNVDQKLVDKFNMFIDLHQL
jgi:hypothetical protein